MIFIFIILLIISYFDFKTLEIENYLLIILTILILLNKELDIYSSALYTFPLISLLIIEEFINYEIIGFADIKLMYILGFSIKNNDIYSIISFYKLTFILAFFYSIIIKLFRNEKYIPFAPFLSISYIFFKIKEIYV